MKTIDCFNSFFRNLASSRLIFAFMLLMGHSMVAAEMSDNFGQRPLQSGLVATFTGDSSGAGLEPGEIAGMHGNARNHTLWAAWSAPQNGWVTIDTLGSSVVGACLSVYTGEAIPQLTPIARGYDLDGSGPNPASVRFPVAVGITYQIVVDSTVNNSSGDGLFSVNVKLTPASQAPSIAGTDLFNQRRRINGTNGFGVANTEKGGVDAFEVASIGSRLKTVWWEWTAPGTGRATVDTLASDFNTTLTVYAGAVGTMQTAFSALEEVSANNDIPNDVRSLVQFQTEAGRTYQIRVDGAPNNSSGEGNVVLALNFAQNFLPPGIPGGDLFERRGTLQGPNALGIAYTQLFGSEAFEPAQIGNRKKTAWWAWTAVADGAVIVDTQGSDFDTALTIFEGSSLGGLHPVVANNNVPSGTYSEVQFNARRGTVYFVCLDGNPNNSAGEGNGVVRLNQLVSPPRDLAIYTAVEIEFFGRRGVTYQVQRSQDLIRWQDWNQPFIGEDLTIRLLDSTRSQGPRYFRYLQR